MRIENRVTPYAEHIAHNDVWADHIGSRGADDAPRPANHTALAGDRRT